MPPARRNGPLPMAAHRTIAAVLLCLTAGNLAAQAPMPDSTWRQEKPAVPARGGPHVIRLWEVAAVAGGIAATTAADLSLRTYVQDHRSHSLDSKLAIFRHMGQPEVFATVSLGVVGAGLVLGNPRLTRAGLRIVGAVGGAGAAALVIKQVVGRVRPENNPPNQYQFNPFSGDASFPSGHTTVAFALAASLSDEIHNRWATLGLYSAASLTAWSRVNDNRHWLSDTIAGAAVGIASAKLVNGHWQVFHIRPPGWLVPTGKGVALSFQF